MNHDPHDAAEPSYTKSDEYYDGAIEAKEAEIWKELEDADKATQWLCDYLSDPVGVMGELIAAIANKKSQAYLEDIINKHVGQAAEAIIEGEGL